MPEDLDTAVEALLGAVREDFGRDVVQVTLSPQQSGEVPYQVLMRGDEIPLAGLSSPVAGASTYEQSKAPEPKSPAKKK